MFYERPVIDLATAQWIFKQLHQLGADPVSLLPTTVLCRSMKSNVAHLVNGPVQLSHTLFARPFRVCFLVDSIVHKACTVSRCQLQYRDNDHLHKRHDPSSLSKLTSMRFLVDNSLLSRVAGSFLEIVNSPPFFTMAWC